jgi:hypothetical protein
MEKEPLMRLTVVSLIRADQRAEGSVDQRFLLARHTTLAWILCCLEWDAGDQGCQVK